MRNRPHRSSGGILRAIAFGVLAMLALPIGVAPARTAPVTQPATRPAQRGPAVVALLEDNADMLLPLLDNPTGDPGAGYVEREEVFSGRSSMRIAPLQRFSPKIQGWSHRIVADAQEPGEYRYLRFAWKTQGSSGMMIQFHDSENWNVRYCAGRNHFDWQARQISDKPPTQWTLVTIDLFAENGPRTLQGIALTTFDGHAGFFDHIYLGRTIPDLDAIDATGLRTRTTPPAPLSDDHLNRLWRELTDVDAGKAYRAFWTLVADPQRARPFLEQRCKPVTGMEAAALAGLIEQLDDGEWKVRERATEALRERIHDARPQLTKAIEGEGDVPPETRKRIAALLKLVERNEAGVDPRTLAARALAHMEPAP